MLGAGTLNVDQGSSVINTAAGIAISNSASGQIINKGTIIGTAGAATISNSFSALVLTNTGTIRNLPFYPVNAGYSVRDAGAGHTQTINNLQGGSNGALTFTSITTRLLPSYYNMIAYASNNYGQFAADIPNVATNGGIMRFGIFAGDVGNGIAASTLSAGTYTSVLSGVASANLFSLSGSYGSYTWNLVAGSGSNVWDLVVAPPATNISGSGNVYLASNLGSSVNPVFAGGILQMNQVNTSYSQNFTVDTSNTNTIDQYGNTSTFTGVFSNAVSGQAGNIVIANSTQNGGKVIFSGNNTYTGLTTINSGASLQIGSGGTSGSIVGDVVNNGILGFNRSNALSYAGSISGAGSLTQLGSGALTLSGTNSYTGGTTVSSGSLIGTTSSLQGAITNNAAVTFSQNTDGTYAGNMTGTGSFTKLGSGAVTLSGTNSYSGGTTVTAGSLIGNTSSLQGNIVNNASVKFNQITDGTYAGSMSGTGSLIKLGAATLTLTGNNSYTGGTTILAGAIVNNGTYSSDIVVDAGGTLSGTGTFVNVSIGDGGTLAPGSAGSVGTMTINGNLVLDPDPATTDITISGKAASKVNVSGTASLGGAVVASGSFPAAAYLPTTKYNILTATGGLSGQFGSVSTSVNYTFLTPTLYYNSNDVTLGFALTPFSTVAKNINQRNVGNALTVAALGPVNALGAPILNALFSGNYQNAQAVMDTVGGSGLAGVQSTAMQVGEMASSSVSDQIAFWRSGETMDATGRTSQEGNNPRNFLAYAPVQRNVPAKGPINLKGPAGSLTAAVAPRTFRAWGSMFGGGANYLSDAGRGAAASNIGYYGGLIGVDYQVQPNILVGVAVGGSSSSFNVGSLSTNGNLTGFHAGVYGAYTMGNSYIALNETFSAYNNQTSRKAGGYAYLPYEQLSAQFGSTEFRTREELGHGVLMGGLKATPFIAAEIAAYQSNAFSEQSSIYASTFALKNNGQGINSLPTFAGLRLSNAVTLSNGWRLAPVGSVAYVHEFFPQRQFNNILMSMPGADFNVAGPRSTYNLVQTKIGAQLNLNEKLALFTDFQGEFSPVSQSYAGKGGVKYIW